MIHVEMETLIDRPIDEVFSQLTDLNGYNAWMSKSGLFQASEQTSSESVGIGTTFRDRLRHGEATGEIVAFQRPTSVAFRQTVKLLGVPCLESRPRYSLEEEEGRTRVRHVAEGECRGVFRIFEGVFAKIAEAERRRTLVGLKRSLESPP